MVAPLIVGAGIQAGTALIGGLLGQAQANKANDIARLQFSKNLWQQDDQRHHGVRYRVEDAKRAGIHPLAALGANIPTYAPTSSAFMASPLGATIARGGQDIGRAISAYASNKERAAVIREQAAARQPLVEAQIRESNARTMLLEAQAAKVLGTTPPGTGPGIGNSDLIRRVPAEVTRTNPKTPYLEPGQNPDVGHVRTGLGYHPVPGEKTKERIEDSIFQEAMHFFRNVFLPGIGINQTPPNTPLKKGEKWLYDWVRGYVRSSPKRMSPMQTRIFIRKHMNRLYRRRY